MFPDFIEAPNIGTHPEIYERENRALLRDGRLQAALRAVADWEDRRVLDIGTGTGFWLQHYPGARSVIGVEPDPRLLERASARVAGSEGIEVRAGSAEHLPLPDASVDVAHARWAYFFGPGSERGLAEVDRVLRPGGRLVVVDNAWGGGEFAELLEHATGGNADHDPDAIARWWSARGAVRHEILAGWAAESPAELEQILRIEFPGATVDRFVARHTRADLTYAMALYAYGTPERG